MIKDKAQRKGIALGAIFAFVVSMFGALPAQAAPSTSAFTIVAAGDDSSTFATFIDDDFTLLVARNASEVSETDFNSYLHYSITTTRTYGSTYSITVDTSTESDTAVHSVTTEQDEPGQSIYYNGSILTGVSSTISGTVSGNIPAEYPYVVAPQGTGTGQPQKISFRLDGGAEPLTSASPSVTVTVTAFLDLNGNNKWDSATEPSATQAFSFKKYSEVAPSVTLGAVEAGTSHVTASATFAGLNVGQLPGKFAVRFTAWQDTEQAGISYSAIAEQTPTYTLGYSMSDNITLATAAAAGNTFSAQIVYDSVSAYLVLGTGGTTEQALTKFAKTTVTVAAASVTGGTLYAVTNANAKVAGGSVFAVRTNNLITVRATFSGVASTSATTATWTFPGVTLDATKTLSVNGGTAEVTATHSAVTSTVNKTTGVTEITLLSSGFGLSDNLTVSVKVPGLAAMSIALDTVAETWTLTQDATHVSATPGSAISAGVTVKDQWSVNSTKTDQRVKFTWTAGYSGTATVSYATVAAGTAQATLTPTRTPTTGSATVTMQLQYLNGNVWTDTGSSVDTVVYITEGTAGFRTGLAASYSASISYGASYSWSSAINAAYVTNTGSSVVVSGTGLIFRDANDATSTGSDTLTLPGNSTGQVAFEVTARLAGTYTVTLTSGTATTTSLIVVAPARSDAGASISWDTTNIVPGKTKIVTGTLVDANGNPVDTTIAGTSAVDSGTASIVVTYTGTAGIPVGTMPTETDADGKFRVSILTSAADDGSFTLTATYLPQGTATAAADKVMSSNVITVGASAASADQKITVGSFKGYVAIYTRGYEGQKLSAKVAGKWLVVDPIVNMTGKDHSRVVRLTGAGYTIKVDTYIDGVLMQSDTIVTK